MLDKVGGLGVWLMMGHGPRGGASVCVLWDIWSMLDKVGGLGVWLMMGHGPRGGAAVCICFGIAGARLPWEVSSCPAEVDGPVGLRPRPNVVDGPCQPKPLPW